jgi:Gluconate 2-dehydrogenase subunit 3
MTHYAPKLSRRTTLQWMAATSMASSLPHRAPAIDSQRVEFTAVPRGYGTDPNLKAPVIPWPLLMTAHQLEQTAILADLILPGTTAALAPSAIGVPEFINEWVSAPYPDQLRDRVTLVGGLRWLDVEAAGRANRGFLELSEALRQSILNDIGQRNPKPPFIDQQLFFQRLQYLIVGAYYTTPEGFRDLGYIGNVPIANYPPITEEERAILDKALMRLGLSRS